MKKLSSASLFRPEIFSFFGKMLHGFDYADIDYRLFNGFSFPPKSVCLILSEKCNLHCRMCDIGSASKMEASGLVQAISSGNTALDLHDWKLVLQNLAAYVPRPLVLLTGTEPFVSPHADSVIALAAENNLPLHITTNGVLLEQYAVALTELCRKPFSLDITVSLDGPADIHDDIRGMQGVYAKAIRGIQAVAVSRAKLGIRNPRINITCTISNYNAAHLESFVAGVAELHLPVDAITFNHLWFKDSRIAAAHNSRYGDLFPVSQDNSSGIDYTALDMLTIQAQLDRIRKRFRGMYRIHQFPDLSAADAPYYYSDTSRFVFYDHCTAPWRNVAITPRGNVILSPLCFLGNIGNVHSASFHTIWQGNSMKNLRKILKKKKAFPACSRCCMLFGSRPKFYKLKDWLL